MDEQRQTAVGKKLTYTVVPGQAGNLSNSYTKGETDKKFKDINYIVIWVVAVLLLMVATLLIDSFHINSAIYKEYSQKTTSVETSQKVNQELLEQNKKNQEIIIELQTQLLKK